MAGVLWAETSRERPVRSTPLAGGESYDLLIVGGGYCGLSTALHAARAGLSVGLLEAGVIGNGASGRNGGFAVPHFPGAVKLSDVERLIGRRKSQRLGELVATGSQKVFDRIRHYQIECDGEQNGWVQPAHSERSLQAVRAVHDDWKAFGADIEWLDREAVTRELGAAGYLGGWKGPVGGTVNPLALSRGLARAAANEGAVLHERAAATAIRRDGDRLVVESGRGSITARKVLIATNGYSGPLSSQLSATVIPVHLWHAVTEPLSKEARSHILPQRQCFTDLRRSGGFSRYDAGNRLISGGLVFALGDRRKGGMRHARQRIKLLYPDLPEPQITHYWEGYCAVTKPFLPSLQVLDKDLFAILGFSTRGVALAQNIGMAAAEFLAEQIGLDDVPLPVSEPEPIPWQGLKSLAGRLAFPYFKALDRWQRT